MITELKIANFRPIRRAELELSKINVITGENNSGKSSIIYALLAIKNVLSNPNQPLDSFFNFGFLNLGGFKETVHLKDDDKSSIEIEIQTSTNGVISKNKLKLGKKSSELGVALVKPYEVSLKHQVTFPYPLNVSSEGNFKADFGTVKITWNGISQTSLLIEGFQGTEEEKRAIQESISDNLVSSGEGARSIELIPLMRGFDKSFYNPIPLQANQITQDEVATALMHDRDWEGRVNFYLEKIVNRTFNVRPISPGSASHYLQTRDRFTGFVCDLVNEGFGTNQLVYLLAKSLRKGYSTICIEEPEIHLHPEAVNKLVEAIVEITENENKCFIISTHSEHFVISLLNKVAQQKIKLSDINMYYVHKDKKESIIEKQVVNEKGQVEGGLKGFYEVQLQEAREFLKIQG